MCLVGPGLFLLGSYTLPRLTVYDTTEIKPAAILDLQPGEEPGQVCLIPGDKVAVMCGWSNTIVIVSVKNNQLQREHAINIDSRSMCITSYKDYLFVVTGNVTADRVSISRVTLSGDRHVVCDLPERWKMYLLMHDYLCLYSITISKESKPKIYVAHRNNCDMLEVSLDGSTLRSISMPSTEGGTSIMNVVSVGENILCLFSQGRNMILADIKSEKTSIIIKQKTERWFYWVYFCPITKTLLLHDEFKNKSKLFKWK